MLPVLDGYLATQFSKNFTSALEIGVYKGGWLFTLIDNNLNIVAIGIDPYPNLEIIRKSFTNERDRFGLEKNIYLYSSFNELSDSKHNLVTYDIIHLDGEHSQSQVNQDLKNLLPLLKDNGLLIIDDIFYHSYPGVTAATFSFIKDNNLSPFLFTEKKIYICNPSYYTKYYEKTISILNSLKINYEENEKLNSKPSYAQSNSIFGFNLIITPEKLKSKEIVNMLEVMNLTLPLSMKIKNTFRNFLPPKFLELVQFSKSKLIRNKLI
jgi:hypothetical protein